MTSPRITLGEPLRFRVETTMRKALGDYAGQLTAAVGHTVSVAGAVRDLVSRGLANAPDAGYLSGFREGFIAAYAATNKKLTERANQRRLAQADENERGPIGPHPPRDNGDYQAEGEPE